MHVVQKAASVWVCPEIDTHAIEPALRCAAAGPISPVRLRNMSIRHLKTRKQFQSMLAHPPIAKTSHFALHRAPVHSLLDAEGGSLLFANPPGTAELCDSPWWVGALVPKRWAKHAVTRNLVRRNVYAIALELSRSASGAEPSAVATPSDNAQPAAQESYAYLIRLRASFHTANAGKSAAHKKHSSSKATKTGKAHSQQAAGKAKPLFKSAASELLKSSVREQLFTLFARAAQADAEQANAEASLRARAQTPIEATPAAALNPLKEAGQDA